MKEFEKLVKIDPSSNCWNWHGQYDREGKPFFHHETYKGKAQRVSWRLYRGDSPRVKIQSESGGVYYRNARIMNACKNTSCVNPRHLSLADTPQAFFDSYRVK